MYFYINNFQYLYIYLIIIAISLPIYYIKEFIEFKKFVKKYYYKDIKFISFTLNLIKHKIRAIF